MCSQEKIVFCWSWFWDKILCYRLWSIV